VYKQKTQTQLLLLLLGRITVLRM